MTTSSFNFHGLVGFSLQSQATYAHQFFRSEYGWAAVKQLPASRITLYWTHSAVPILHRQAGTYHQHKFAARWRYRLHIEPDSVEIHAVGNAIALTMVHHMLIHPSLRLLASRKGVILLHGAGLVLDGKSLVISGVGGTGKTTTTSLLLDQGDLDWRLHADDYTFISEEAVTYAYLTRAHIYRGLLDWVPRLSEQVELLGKIRLALNNFLLKATGGRVRWAVRLPLNVLWPKRTESARGNLAGLLMLRRKSNTAPAFTPITDSDQLLAELMEMNMYEARHFIHLLNKALASDYVEPIVDEWQQREHRILACILTKVKSYWLDLPAFPVGDQAAGHLIEAVIAEMLGIA